MKHLILQCVITPQRCSIISLVPVLLGSIASMAKNYTTKISNAVDYVILFNPRKIALFVIHQPPFCPSPFLLKHLSRKCSQAPSTAHEVEAPALLLSPLLPLSSLTTKAHSPSPPLALCSGDGRHSCAPRRKLLRNSPVAA